MMISVLLHPVPRDVQCLWILRNIETPPDFHIQLSFFELRSLLDSGFFDYFRNGSS